MKWLASDEEFVRAYIGRHVLDAQGLNNRVLLDALADRNGGVINISKFLGRNGQADTACVDFPESIESIMKHSLIGQDSSFHREGGTEEDILDKDNMCINVEDDKPN